MLVYVFSGKEQVSIKKKKYTRENIWKYTHVAQSFYINLIWSVITL